MPTNLEIIAQRTTAGKPELPRELSRFNPFWARLPKVPLGPIHKDGAFYVDRIDIATAEEIRLLAMEGKSIKEIMNTLANTYGMFLHAETVINHIPKDAKTKLFVKADWKADYVKQFEEARGIFRYARGADNSDRIKEAYKPFVIWCIENSYGYWQIESIPDVAGTIRQWANGWGYAKDERTYNRTPDLTGKKNRSIVNYEGEEAGQDSATIIDVAIDRAHKCLSFPKQRPEYGSGSVSTPTHEILARYSVEQLCQALVDKGFNVNLEYIPVIISRQEQN